MNIAVLLSGGVDSAVALKLLLEQGHNVTAFYLKIWLEDELSYLGNCPWEEDLEYVQKICSDNGLPLEVIPLQEEYHERIVTYTLDEIRAGRTPNPDVLCNSRIKFGAFFDRVSDSFEMVATGHYARTQIVDGVTHLRMAKDTFKDQTYFLSHLRQDQVAKLVFPVGDYLKSEVRELASKYDLPNKDRKDSQGICFLGKIPFSDFLRHHLGERKGDLLHADTGEKIGEHEGFWYYTIGQRKNIRLPDGPWYVVSKDIDANTVSVSNTVDALTGTTNTYIVGDLNWISGTPSTKSSLKVKVRHGEKMYGCDVEYMGETLRITMDGADYIAPGQFAVLYEGDICLGGGIIQSS